MDVGASIETTVDDLDDRGAGSASVEGLSLHVPGALPQERITARIEHISRHRRDHGHEAWARLVDLHASSPDRVAPVCPAHGACGGCVLQHLAYPAQLAWKQKLVARALAGNPALASVPIVPCIGSPRPLGYRNQAKYVYGRASNGKIVLGAYAPRSHTMVDMAGCRTIEPALDHLARALRADLERHAVAPFDERTKVGLLRYVIVRANVRGELLITLVTATETFGAGERIASALMERHMNVVGVVQNINPHPGNVLFGSDERLLAGRGTLEDEIGPTTVALSSRAFFQVNREVAGLAYTTLAQAVAALGAVERVVDVYAGAGAIAFSLAPLAREVIAIEENGAATSSAGAQAAKLGLSHVRFMTGDASTLLPLLDCADVVVVNPPRAGCAREVLDAIARLRPRLLGYLSCNPETLVRDLARLQQCGFVATAITPYDMLPHTPHVEALAIVTRKFL